MRPKRKSGKPANVQSLQEVLTDKLSTTIPLELAEKIWNYFITLKREYTLGHYDDSVQKAELLSQAVAKAIFHTIGEKWHIDSDVRLDEFKEKVHSAIIMGKLPKTAIALAHIAKALRAIRSKKDVAHMHAQAATKIDADFAVAAGSWMIKELLICTGTPLGDEHISTGLVINVPYPLVEKINEEYIVHHEGPAREKILLLLYWLKLHNKNATIDEIVRAIPNVAEKTVRNTLPKLVRETLIVPIADGGSRRQTYTITMKGIAEVSNIVKRVGSQ